MRPFQEYFKPDELHLLQECLDTILAANKIACDSLEGDFIAGALLKSYQRGVRDRETLLSLADMYGSIAARPSEQGDPDQP